MGRVLAIFLLRRLFSPITLMLVALLFFVGEIFSAVSLRAVAQNMPGELNPGSHLGFWSSAVVHTEIGVQITGLLLLALLSWSTYRTLSRLISKRKKFFAHLRAV